ncbi:hypothetical protein V865_003181 [Kwoniella europaea PYCC6329]|uniref:JmjC domain-containing protein n=1 Tax=Kwoniella europaea PYCC6329 TaxID=1423913 RepID=A0AAX4KGD5_9TREE
MHQDSAAASGDIPTLILSDLATKLKDGDCEETRDIKSCGPAVLCMVFVCVDKLLRFGVTAEATSHSRADMDMDMVLLKLKTLETLSHEMINTIPFNVVPRHWLRLYTDISLIRVIHDLIIGPRGGMGEEVEIEGFWMEAIRRLDKAIIVADAIGNRRKKWALDLIKITQTKLSLSPLRCDEIQGSRSRAKRFKLEEPPIDTSLLFAPNPIPVLQEPPSIEEYLQNYLNHPFILRGYLRGTSSSPPWPACDRWSSAEYLVDTVGRGRVIPVEVGKAYDDINWTQRIVPFTEFLHRAGFKMNQIDVERRVTEPSSPLYLAQYALFDQFPELEKDMCFPDYVWSNPPPPDESSSYTSPPNDDGLIVNVWVGSGNSEIISPAHTDPYYNCYAQVLGRKRVWLAPPSCGPYMHAYGEKTEVGDGLADQYMTNTSKVPILKPIDDFKRLESTYPEFFDHVWPRSLEELLESGDMMVMPPGWWHAMRAEGTEPAWSVSMWY